MPTIPNAVIRAKEPKRKKSGGKLSGNRSHQGSAAQSVCGQPGNTNAFKLGALMAHQRSARRHEALA